MAATEATLNIAADAVGAAVAQLSLHSADPGATGANELPLTGAYTREVPDYSGAAAGGVDDLAAPVTFGGPAVATNAGFLGFWAAGSVWLGGVALTAAKPGFIDPDTLEVTSAPVQAAVPS
ncbi:hypothetical protein [Jiangella asiatica]|uniref:Uncharacterized protein n=1 Tax=Jiangella asiatica TaxID=2530372 RepID=A0A4R5CQM3_9ACTN|nr:hypothetical protein [Jiangella asiatica]TDE02822.1 hypothetical protein E1269_21260 [Jiangella asiatica]